jgi:hypothetical protein
LKRDRASLGRDRSDAKLGDSCDPIGEKWLPRWKSRRDNRQPITMSVSVPQDYSVLRMTEGQR